jgi:hypothetical protein
MDGRLGSGAYGIHRPVAKPGAYPPGQTVCNRHRLLLDSRVVDVLMAYNPTLSCSPS